MHAQAPTPVGVIMQRLADKALLVALAITGSVAIILGVVNGWSRGTSFSYSLAWAAFAIAVVCVEFGCVKKAMHYKDQRQFGMMVVAIVVGALALVASTFATFNSAASNIDLAQSNTLRKSDTYSDARKRHDAAGKRVEVETANVATLRAELAAAVPKVGDQAVTTVGQAESLVQKAKSDRWFTTTNSCTETKGPQTSRFCSDYRQALGAVDVLKARGGQEAKLAEAEAALKTAQAEATAAEATASAAPPVVSKDSPFVRNVMRMTGVSREDAAIMEAGIPSIIMQVFLMFLGIMSTGAEKRIDGGLAQPASARDYAPRPIMAYSQNVAHPDFGYRPQPIHIDVHHNDPYRSAMDAARARKAG